MPFLLLLCLSLACLPVDDWHALYASWKPWHGLVGTLATLGILLAYVFQITWRTRYRLRTRPEQRDRWLTAYGHARTRFVLLAMGLFVIALFGCGWGLSVRTVVRGWIGTHRPLPPGIELLILAPLPLSLALSWAVFYDAERAVLQRVRPFGGRWGYVGLQLRQSLALICAPVIVLAVVNGVFRQFAVPETMQTWILLPFGVATVILLPRIVRLILKLTPLPPSSLRSKLEASAKRMNCRCSDVLVWDTRNGVANAMVVGLVPWLRYVLLSDRLIDEFTPDEVESVFGHEAGHIRHLHMPYYLAFLTGSLAVVSRGLGLLEVWAKTLWPETLSVPGLDTWMALPMTLGLAAYIFGVFGFLSRQCERQADIDGCRAVSCPDPLCFGHDEKTIRVPGGAGLCPAGIFTFCRALDKVAELNGISRDRPGWLHSWQHSTIAKRVAFLERMAADPTLEPRFQKRLFQIKVALLAATALAAAVLWSL
jgi:STE24 endopeptidase